MDAIDRAVAVRDDKAITSLPWRKQVEIREQVWNDYVVRDRGANQDYGLEGLDLIKNKFMTEIPDELKQNALRNGNMDEITPELADSWKEGWINANKLNDIENVRGGRTGTEGSNSTLEIMGIDTGAPTATNSRNFGTGLVRGLNAVGMTGVLGNKIAEAIIGEDVYTSPSTQEIEEYRDFVNKTYGHKDIDYGIGRGIGVVAASINMMYGFHKVFGAVGEAGLLTKGMQEAVKVGTANSGPVLRAVLPWLAQATVETTGGVAYNMANDMIRGNELSIVTQPGKEILSELIFFGAGESIARGISASVGGMGRIYSGKRFKDTWAGVDLNKAPKQVTEDFNKVIMGEAEGLGEESIKYLNTLNPDVAKNVNEAIQAARHANARIEAGEAKEGIEEYLYKTLYKAETIVNTDGTILLKNYDGKEYNKIFKAGEFQNWLKTTVDEAKNVNFDELAQMYGRRYSPTTVGVRGKTGFKASSLKFDDVVNTFVPHSGEVDLGRVKSFLQSHLGKTADDIEIKYVDDFFKRDIQFDKKTLYVPKSLADGLQSKAFADSMYAQIKNIDPKFKFGTKKFTKYITEIGNFAKYDEGFFKSLGDVSDFKIGKDGKVAIGFKGEALSFNSLDEAGAAIHGSYFTDEEFAAYLAKQHNMKLSLESKTGKYTVTGIKTKNGKKVTDNEIFKQEFDNIEELFLKVPQIRPPIPIQMGPDMLIISPRGLGNGQFTVDGGRVFEGSAEDAIKTLRRFQDTGQYKEVKELANGNSVKLKNNELTYTVEFKDAGIKIETQDYDEAMKFAGMELDKFDSIEKLARHKGFDIELTRGGFRTRGMDGSVNAFKDTEEAINFLKKQDELTNMAELTGQDDAIIGILAKQAEKPVEELKRGLWEALKRGAKVVDKKFHRTTPGLLKSKYLETTLGRLERLNDPVATNLMRKMFALNEYNHRTLAAYDKQLYQMYGNFDAHQRNQLGSILLERERMTDLSYEELAKKRNFELTDNMMDALDGTRKIFDTLSSRYGVSTSMYLKDYFPRIRDIDPADFLKQDISSKKIMKDAFAGGSLADYSPFFQHVRVDELASTNAFKSDILNVMKTYIQTGERNLMFGDLITEINTYIKNLGKSSTDMEVMKILQHGRDQVAGRVYSSEHAEQVAERIMLQRAKADEILKSPKYKTDAEQFNAADRAMRHNTTEILNDLITSNLMAMKLRLPMRNMLQIYTTSGGLTGNTAIVKAQQRVNKNFDALYTKWADRGVLMARDPLDPTRVGMQKWLKGYNSAGMNHFRTSDDYTRMVTAEAWDILLTDAQQLMKTGRIDYKGFENLTWTKLLDEADKVRFDELMKSGRTELANTLMSQRMTELTIFNYDSLMRPEGWKFGMGKLFGQYQTYPLQYMRMVKKIASVSTPAEMAVYTSRMMINTAAVGIYMNDILGMRGAPMTPLGTMSITGGPWVSALARAYTGVTAFNTDALTKVKSLARSSQSIIPLYSMGRKAWQASEAFAQGEAMVGAVYAMGGTPVEEKFTDPDEWMAGGLEAIYGIKGQGKKKFKAEYEM